MVNLSHVKSDTAKFLMDASDNDKGRYQISGLAPRRRCFDHRSGA